MYLHIQILHNVYKFMLVFYYKIIGDVKKHDGSFEYGSLFYMQMKRDPKAYTKGSKWWFVKPTDIRSLQNPRTAQISKKHLYYYFDNYQLDA